MRLALIADTFPPLRTSGAVQLRDLSLELVAQGHHVTVLLPSADLKTPWSLESLGGVEVLRLRSPQTKDVGYVRRTLAEFAMPFSMLRNLKRSQLGNVRWDGVVWYAPSIFHGPLAAALKRASRCRSYLVIRDIFPEWAVDMGLLRRGPPYLFFRAVAAYQYSVADVIGVQTPGNLTYFKSWVRPPKRRLEVLQNWLADAPMANCRIDVAASKLAGRKIFVYAGNMGIAQGMDILLDLARALRTRSDIGFLFVGRGSDAQRLAAEAERDSLDNVQFHDEIPPEEIRRLYAQCHAGMLALDPRHRTHNIPGKFLTYMQAGLPVLASINRGNDLANLIRSEDVGRVIEDGAPESLVEAAVDLLAAVDESEMSANCRALYARQFSAKAAAKQIAESLREP